MKNKLYIMVGIPGSGKSTYAKTNILNATYVSRDVIRFQLVSENEEYFSKEKEVFSKFINIINSELATGHDVIADATHINSRSRMKLLSHLNLNKEKIDICIIVMKTSLDTCLKHNENRKGTRSYVPPDVIKDMYYSFEIPSFTECNKLINEIRMIIPGDD